MLPQANPGLSCAVVALLHPITPGLLEAAILLSTTSSALVMPTPPWHSFTVSAIICCGLPQTMPACSCILGWGLQGCSAGDSQPGAHVGAGDTLVCPRWVQIHPAPATRPLPWHPLSMKPSVLLAQSLQQGVAEDPRHSPCPCLEGLWVTNRCSVARLDMGLAKAMIFLVQTPCGVSADADEAPWCCDRPKTFPSTSVLCQLYMGTLLTLG